MRHFSLLFALIAGALPLLAQTTTPPPKKDPFANFGKTGLDRGKASPSTSLLPAPKAAPSAPGATGTKGGGLKLNGGWDSRVALSRGGPTNQSRELHALIVGFVAPGVDLSPSPATRIYRNVTYLLPFTEAQARVGLGGKLKSGGKSAAVGYPDGIEFVSFSADGGRAYETRVLYDKADQVVAVQFTANDPRMLPPPPDPLPVNPDKFRQRSGSTYDFVPQGTSAAGQRYSQRSWDVRDYILIATRGGPRAADLYLPKPMARLVLHSLDSLSGP